MLKVRVALVLVIVLFGVPAIAGQITVGDLHKICSGTDYESRAACRFYILSVTEGAGLGAGVAKAPASFCIYPTSPAWS
jgi:hypothetical protein